MCYSEQYVGLLLKEAFSVLGERQMSIVFFSVKSAAGSTLSVGAAVENARFPVRPWHDIVSATGV